MVCISIRQLPRGPRRSCVSWMPTSERSSSVRTKLRPGGHTLAGLKMKRANQFRARQFGIMVMATWRVAAAEAPTMTAVTALWVARV
jgi:hypothetical protein